MEIISYACGKGEQPENSLEGIQNSQDVDSDMQIEMDIQMTADNEIILCHDASTLRTTGQNHMVSKMTLKDLRLLNFGHTFYLNHSDSNSNFIKIPALKEVFHSFPNARLILDISTNNHKIIELLFHVFDKYKTNQEITIVSEYDTLLKLSKKTFPQYRTAAGSSEVKSLLFSGLLRMDNFFPLQSDILMAPEYYGKLKILSNRIIEHTKSRNKKIIAWKQEGSVVKLIDSLDDYNHFKSLGVDGIFTSKPRSLYHELAVNHSALE